MPNVTRANFDDSVPCAQMPVFRSTVFRRVLAGSLFIGSLLTAAGCERSMDKSRKRESSSTIRIAVVPRGVDDPIWPIMKTTMDRENSRPETGDVVFEACVPEWSDPASQVLMLNSLHSKGYRGVVVWPADALQCGAAMNALAKSGTVVVAAGVPLESDLLDLFCSEDPGQVGARVADLAAQTAKKKGTIGVLHLGQEDSVATRRLQAFEARLRQYSWAVVLVTVDVGGPPAQARQRFSEALQRYPRTRLWVSLSGWPIRLRDRTPLATVSDDVTLVVTDPSPLQWSSIREGRIAASVGVDYQKMMERAIQMCGTLCRGETVQLQRHFLPVETVDQGNLDEWINRWSD